MLKSIFNAIWLDIKPFFWNRYVRVFGPHIFVVVWFSIHLYIVHLNNSCGCSHVSGKIILSVVMAAAIIFLEVILFLILRGIFKYYQKRLSKI